MSARTINLIFSVMLVAAAVYISGRAKSPAELTELSVVADVSPIGGTGGPTGDNTDLSDELETGKMERATFAAGCFWGVEATFRQIKGVISTQVGYAGGHTESPSYGDVCSDTTGHAEAVEVTFDPSKVSYQELLKVFWENHDPTTLNRQGPDYGSQYRSVIFYYSEQQRDEAMASKQALEMSGTLKRPIVTEIIPAGRFWRAEEYHQQYLEKRGLSTCRIK